MTGITQEDIDYLNEHCKPQVYLAHQSGFGCDDKIDTKDCNFNAVTALHKISSDVFLGDANNVTQGYYWCKSDREKLAYLQFQFALLYERVDDGLRYYNRSILEIEQAACLKGLDSVVVLFDVKAQGDDTNINDIIELQHQRGHLVQLNSILMRLQDSLGVSDVEFEEVPSVGVWSGLSAIILPFNR